MKTLNLAGGFIDLLLLQIISHGDSYGYSISKTIAKITQDAWEIKEATLYSGLRRLEAEGFVETFWGDEAQGGRRKYYSLTYDGREYLNHSLIKWVETKKVVEKIIEWDGDNGQHKN